MRRMIRYLALAATLASFQINVAYAGMLEDLFTPPDKSGIVSVESFMPKIYEIVPGVVDDIELERKNNRWIYEISILADDGRKVEFKVDALTGKILSQKAKYRNPWE